MKNTLRDSVYCSIDRAVNSAARIAMRNSVIDSTHSIVYAYTVHSTFVSAYNSINDFVYRYFRDSVRFHIQSKK
jgi:hypothetical protein